MPIARSLPGLSDTPEVTTKEAAVKNFYITFNVGFIAHEFNVRVHISIYKCESFVGLDEEGERVGASV